MTMIATVRHFYHHDIRYSHQIHLDTDDIYLKDAEDTPLLCFKSNGPVVDALDTLIGSFSLVNDSWVFTHADGHIDDDTASINAVEGLIDLEIRISKQYLTAMKRS